MNHGCAKRRRGDTGKSHLLEPFQLGIKRMARIDVRAPIFAD
jgi:hypothetical protein